MPCQNSDQPYLSYNHPWVNSIDSNPLVSQVKSSTAHQLVQGSLADTVAQDTREGAETCHTGHMDNVALGQYQMRGDKLGQDEGRPEEGGIK